MTPNPRWLEILKASNWQLGAVSAALAVFWALLGFGILPPTDNRWLLYGLPLGILLTGALALFGLLERRFRRIGGATARQAAPKVAERLRARQRERVLEIASIASAAAAVLSALFVGYQALLFRQALDDPFQANLQARQIEACEDFIVANRRWELGRELPSVTAGTRYSLSDPVMVTVFPIDGRDAEELEEEYQAALGALVDELGRTGSRLRVFSGPGDALISEAGRALTMDYLMRIERMRAWIDLAPRGPMEQADFEAALAASVEEVEKARIAQGVSTYKEAVEPLVSRCRALMTGDVAGLL